MLKLGKIQTLKILREKDFGVFVGEEGGDSVLLPIRQVPKGKTVGDEVSVFLYKDSKDRLIATTKKPYLEVGDLPLCGQDRAFGRYYVYQEKRGCQAFDAGGNKCFPL